MKSEKMTPSDKIAIGTFYLGLATLVAGTVSYFAQRSDFEKSIQNTIRMPSASVVASGYYGKMDPPEFNGIQNQLIKDLDTTYFVNVVDYSVGETSVSIKQFVDSNTLPESSRSLDGMTRVGSFDGSFKKEGIGFGKSAGWNRSNFNGNMEGKDTKWVEDMVLRACNNYVERNK
jgi:hypothetical protein